MPGFFTASQVATKAPLPLVPQCGACGLYQTCSSPKMPVSGQGAKGILLLGEAPGEHEDTRGKQFVEKTGKLLEKTLAKFGIDMRKDCWLTNALICHPPKNEIPKDEMVDWCRPNLINTLKELKPEIIIPLGAVAVESLIGWLWKESTEGIMRWAGFQIPCQKLNAWICPTFHPSFVERSEKNPVVELIWRRQLQAAVRLKGRPWYRLPDYKSQVSRVIDTFQAAHYLEQLKEHNIPIAFDYENTTRAPWSGGEVVCCSVAWNDEHRIVGTQSISFPWHGEAIPAMLRLLESSCPKIGQNIKHEEQWTRIGLKRKVRNWVWDTMIAAHWMDSRPGITSLKFQAFVHLGAESYDDHIKPQLKAKKGTRFNSALDEVSLDHLLMYNALDSLYTYDIAMKQMELMEVKDAVLSGT